MAITWLAGCRQNSDWKVLGQSSAIRECTRQPNCTAFLSLSTGLHARSERPWIRVTTPCRVLVSQNEVEHEPLRHSCFHAPHLSGGTALTSAAKARCFHVSVREGITAPRRVDPHWDGRFSAGLHLLSFPCVDRDGNSSRGNGSTTADGHAERGCLQPYP
ncbi:hypothetical protein BD413DRAFT_40357 [Trametes elegans]|nr:hypothetical protein BD413DRAFT_40357 [Trametes elegans]